jgi:hypothetical protein
MNHLKKRVASLLEVSEPVKPRSRAKLTQKLSLPKRLKKKRRD